MRVLLVEEEPDIIAAVSLFFAEIKDCHLEVCTSGEEALLKASSVHPHLVLLTHGVLGKDSRSVAMDLHRLDSSMYIIVSIPERNQELLQDYMISGANDCIPKDRNYISNLVQSVKKALSRLFSRSEMKLPTLSRAEQVAIDENLSDIVLNLDHQGTILYVNRAIGSVLGHDQKDVVQRPLVELIQGDQNRLDFEAFIQNIDSETSFRGKLPLFNHMGDDEEFEVHFSAKDGKWIYGVARKTYPQGAVLETDIQKALEEPEEYVPQRIGPYKVITLLGAGSWGRVYKGFDEHLERFVAIKLASSKSVEEENQLQRFQKEARLLASMNHPNIALIFYLGNLDGLPYFCMEYLPGGSLEDLLQEKKTLDPDVAVSYTMQVALGLEKALEKGIVHLDVKPSNLMLAEQGRLKVVDFGLARTRQELESIVSKLIGTPLYISPEQIRGSIADHRCDIYSLGLTFFRMLYGFVPHSGGKIEDVFQRRLNEELPPLETLDSRIPKAHYRILQKMIQDDPSRRYQAYSELIADLENLRRQSLDAGLSEVLPPVSESSTVQERGLLYDRPFAEILGEIVSGKQSGKLTLSWIDLQKVLHFKEGLVVSVLSNQEGERFLDLLLQNQSVSGKDARRLFSSSSNLFLSYSSAIAEISADARDRLAGSLRKQAEDVLQGLFSWMVGEFIFEEGDFPGQGGLMIRGDEILQKGIKEWMELTAIRRRLHTTNSIIHLKADFQKYIKGIQLAPADAFLLFRFERSIRFKDLLDLSGLSEEEFIRLIYLFTSLGIIELKQEETYRHAGTQTKNHRVKSPEVVRTEPQTVVSFPTGGKAFRKDAPAPIVASSVEKPKPEPPLPEPESKPPAGQPSLGFYYYECAVKSFAARNHWAAVEYCKKALEYKREARIYRLMGNSLATHQAFRHEALDAYKKALEINPRNPLILRDVADLYFASQSYALAKTKYQEVLEAMPEDAHCLSRLKDLRKLHKKK